MEQKDKTLIKIIDLLKSHKHGLTIAEIIKKTGLARNTVLTRLRELVGRKDVDVRQINMAKLHFWKNPEDKKEGSIKVTALKEEHLKKGNKQKGKPTAIDFEKIKKEIGNQLNNGKLTNSEARLKEQRAPLMHLMSQTKHRSEGKPRDYIKTGIPGLDDLFTDGIPKNSTTLVAGGAGSGKTIMCLQMCAYHAKKGEKVLYMSFEESEERLIQHMEDFGWNPSELMQKKNLMLQRFNPFDITRSVDALLMKAKGELLIDVDPVILPSNFKPDIIVVDSLTAIASAFTGKEDSYRIYIEQLFRFFEKIGATAFLITETKQIPTVFSQTGVEEFLADGVIVLYSIKRGNVRENAIEVLKIRGAEHEKKIVAFQITRDGIVVYPEQEVFSNIFAGEEKEE